MSHILVTSVPNLLYLTGQRIDTGERMIALLISSNRPPRLYLHEMFVNLAEDIELDDFDYQLWSDDVHPIPLLAEDIPADAVVGVDKTWASAFLLDLMKSRPTAAYHPSSIVEQLREIKDADEIALLRQSSRIADAVVHEALQLQAFPTSERQVAYNVRQLFTEHDVWDLSFEPIISFGSNSANPHHVPSDHWLEPNKAIVLDIGGIYDNYCSDITRTSFYSGENDRFEEIYKIVLDAHLKALDLIKPGLKFSELDLFIRNEFRKWGYDELFVHRTGHGIGLEAHEGPSIHKLNHDEMKEGAVFTLEPGIYLPGQFGVRIEDIVVVTKSGAEVLNQSSRDIRYLDAMTW